MAQGAHRDDYGAKANLDLIVTRGDGFRKEKNKKKRGSYRGGDITVSLPPNPVDKGDLVDMSTVTLS
jgi:hypothetical protein